jgi:hypothetical protein
MCETFTLAAEVEVRRVMAALEPGLVALYPDWPSGCCVLAASLLGKRSNHGWLILG